MTITNLIIQQSREGCNGYAHIIWCICVCVFVVCIIECTHMCNMQRQLSVGRKNLSIQNVFVLPLCLRNQKHGHLQCVREWRHLDVSGFDIIQ